jgi:hypothetical protein
MNYNILTCAAKNSSSQDQVVKKDIHFHLKLKLTILQLFDVKIGAILQKVMVYTSKYD